MREGMCIGSHSRLHAHHGSCLANRTVGPGHAWMHARWHMLAWVRSSASHGVPGRYPLGMHAAVVWRVARCHHLARSLRAEGVLLSGSVASRLWGLGRKTRRARRSRVGCPRKCRDGSNQGCVGWRPASAVAERRRSRLDGVAAVAQRAAQAVRHAGAQGSRVECRVSRRAAGAGALWVVPSGRVASGPASRAMEKLSREQREQRGCSRCSGRKQSRRSADVYATMHPQCTERPGPGVLPGTRALEGGGVEVICVGETARGRPFRWLAAGSVIWREMSAHYCHDNEPSSAQAHFKQWLVVTASIAVLLLVLQILRGLPVPPI